MTRINSLRLLAASLALLLMAGAGSSLLRCRLSVTGAKATGTELIWESLSRQGAGLIRF